MSQAGIVAAAVQRLQADAKQESYRLDPAGWARDVLGVHAWSKQADVLKSLRDHPRTAVASCHGAGKSLSASVAACWWIAVHPPGEAIVITTAPTYRQVASILWEEMRKHHNAARQRGLPLPGYITQGNEWKIDDGRLVGLGRKPADGDQHAFQGIHRPFVLVLIDEACGVPEELWTAVEAITTTANSRILAIGNPDDRETSFGEVFCHPRYEKLWNRIRIPAYETPNFTGEAVPEPLPDLLIQRSWVDQRRTAWTEEDPRFVSKVLAQFPEQSIMSLFGPAVLARGFDIEDLREADQQGTLYIGVDPARFGDDYTTVVARRGRLAWVVDSWLGMDTVHSAKRVKDLAEKMRMCDADGKPYETDVKIRVDVVGVGAGVVDTLAFEQAQIQDRYGECWYNVREMNGAAAPPIEQGGAVQGYGNARAYWYDQAKQSMANGSLKVAMHDTLHDELEGARFLFRSGKMYMESKEDMRKAGRKSPDFADALIYASAPLHEGLEVGDTLSADAAEFDEAERQRQLYQEMSEELDMLISPY